MVHFKNNESGVILLTVVMVSLVLTVIAVGVMSTSVSQVKTSETVVDTIRVEELAKGIFYQYQQGEISGQHNIPSTIEIDGKDYSVVVQNRGNIGTPNDTDEIRIYINEACEPACDGRECGDDGCGGDCGTCTLPDVCNQSGQCV